MMQPLEECKPVIEFPNVWYVRWMKEIEVLREVGGLQVIFDDCEAW